MDQHDQTEAGELTAVELDGVAGGAGPADPAKAASAQTPNAKELGAMLADLVHDAGQSLDDKIKGATKDFAGGQHTIPSKDHAADQHGQLLTHYAATVASVEQALHEAPGKGKLSVASGLTEVEGLLKALMKEHETAVKSKAAPSKNDAAQTAANQLHDMLEKSNIHLPRNDSASDRLGQAVDRGSKAFDLEQNHEAKTFDMLIRSMEAAKKGAPPAAVEKLLIEATAFVKHLNDMDHPDQKDAKEVAKINKSLDH